MPPRRSIRGRNGAHQMSVNSSLSPDNADASSALLATLQDGALCLTTQETAPESLSQSLMPRRQDCNSHSSIGCEFKAVSNLWQKLNILSKTHGKPHDLVSDVKALHGLYQERLKVFEDGISRIVRNPEERMESSVLRKLLDVPDMRDGSLLILAVKQQQVEAVRFLTGEDKDFVVKDKNGLKVNMVDPNVQGQLGRTALFEACLWGNEEAVHLVLNYKQGWNVPFEHEAGIGYKEVDITKADRDGKTPLMMAVEKRHEQVVRQLTCTKGKQHHPNVAHFLRYLEHVYTPRDADRTNIAKGIDAKDNDGHTALTKGCEVSSADIVRELIKAQANVALPGPQLRTALHIACGKKDVQLVSLLLENSANPNAKDDKGRTPLHLAVDHSEPPLAIVSNLLSRNASSNPRDDKGDTPLHILFKKKREAKKTNEIKQTFESIDETISLILSKGIDAQAQKQLLSMRNHAGDVVYGEEDKRLVFNSYLTEFKKVAAAASSGQSDGVGSGDESILEDILVQLAISDKWTKSCRAKKRWELIYYTVLLALFTVVCILRVGFSGSQYDVNMGLKKAILQHEHGLTQAGNIEFSKLRTKFETLEFMTSLALEIGKPEFDPEHSEGPLSERSVGVVVGAPIIKQWRKLQSNCFGSDWKFRCLSNIFAVDDYPPREFDSTVFSHSLTGSQAGHTAIAIHAKLREAFSYQQIEGDMTWKTASDNFPSGGYFLELPMDRTEQLISSSWIADSLAKTHWVDNFTSALAFEAAVYSPVFDRISTIRLIVEFPPGKGTLTTAGISTFKISSWNFRCRPGYFTIDSIIPCFEVIVFVAVLYYAFISDLIKSYSRRRPLKELSLANAVWVFIIVDILCVFALVFAFFREFTLRRNVERISRISNWGPTGRYISIRELEHIVMAQSTAISAVTFMMWFKLLWTKLPVFQEVNILLSAIKQMMGKLWPFATVLGTCYIAFGSTKFMLPRTSASIKNFLSGISAEFWLSVDQEVDRNDNDSYFGLEMVLGPTFAVFVLVILMGMLETMLMDLYSNEKELAEISWAREQIITVVEELDIEESKLSMTKSKIDADASATPSVSESMPIEESPLTDPKNKRETAIARTIENCDRNDKRLQDSFKDLVHIFRGIDGGADSARFNKSMNETVSELSFVIGHVRMPEGISEEYSEPLVHQILDSMRALGRILIASEKDPFIRLSKPPTENERQLLAEVKQYALQEVGLGDKHTLDGMLAYVVMSNLAKVQLWKEKLQKDNLNDFDSISDQRFLLKALQTETCHSRFLPTFRKLEVHVQGLIVAALEADFNLGQFGQLECVGASLSQLKKVASRPDGNKALHFCLFGMFLVIAGSSSFRGQVHGYIWKGFFESIKALSKLIEPDDNPALVYTRWSEEIDGKLKVMDHLKDVTTCAVLNTLFADLNAKNRASECSEINEAKHIDFPVTFEIEKFSSFDDFLAKMKRAILRLARMLRCDDDKLLPDLVGACLNLDPKSLSYLVSELNKTGIDDGWAMLIMYSPKLLQNRIADKKSTKSQSERLAVGLNCLVHLYFMARTENMLHFQLNKQQDDVNPNGVFEVNCYNVAVDFSTDELARILESTDRCFFLDFKWIRGSLGEAEIRIERI